MPFIEIKKLSVHDPIQQKDLVANITFTLHRQRCLGVIGESGSGKSTLLNIIAGIDSATSGSVNAGGWEVTSLSENKMAEYRSTFIGLIFQFHHLLLLHSFRIRHHFLVKFFFDFY